LGAAAAGLTLLAVMVREAGAARVIASLAGVGPWYGVVAIVSAGWTIVNAWAWRLALQPAQAEFAPVVRAALAADAVSNLTPFMSVGGEPLKVLWLKGLVGGEQATASVVADNLVHAVSAPVFMLVGLLLGWRAFALDDSRVALLMAATCLLLGAGGLLLWASSDGLAAPAARLARRVATHLALELGSRAGASADRAQRVDAAVRSFLRPGNGRFWASLGGHLAGRLLGAVEAWIILSALAIPVSLPGAVFVIAVAHVLVNVVFAFIPSQLGVQEATAYALFQVVGLDPAGAVALMLARRVRGFFWNAVGLALLAVGPASASGPVIHGDPTA
jgi:uncharacterized membrane protein YbhN (UPF0104 family)